MAFGYALSRLLTPRAHHQYTSQNDGLVAKTTDRQKGCRSNATFSQSAQRFRIEQMFKARTAPACRHERGPVYADMEANTYTEESISAIERRPITSTPAVRGYRSWPE